MQPKTRQENDGAVTTPVKKRRRLKPKTDDYGDDDGQVSYDGDYGCSTSSYDAMNWYHSCRQYHRVSVASTRPTNWRKRAHHPGDYSDDYLTPHLNAGSTDAAGDGHEVGDCQGD